MQNKLTAFFASRAGIVFAGILIGTLAALMAYLGNPPNMGVCVACFERDVAGALGSALTSQASVARILFAMGRDGILPRKVFGHVSAKFSTPVYAILTVSAISLLAIWIDLAILASVVSFGALVAFSVVNLSVIKHYFIDMRERNVLLNLIAPAIGFLLTAWLWTSLSGTALTIGLIWLAIGFMWLLVVTRGFRRPTPVLDLEYE